MSFLAECLAYTLGIWISVVFLVQGIGIYNLFRYHSSPPPKPACTETDINVPHVTVIRPVKGSEPQLYECLASTFQQTYPREKLTVYLCVESKEDPAYPTLVRVVADFPESDARIYVESEDPLLHGKDGDAHNLGPNPKIRNMSRAYREAKGNIIWIIDCNVWVSKGVAGRMVDKLCGYLPDGRKAKPYKFVHQLPLVVDISASTSSARSDMVEHGGGHLEEMFMATTHAKFYGAINAVGVAPCIVGKSNMFRKSHLDRITDPAQNPILPPSDISRGRGLDFFSSNICEDHLIGDLLWRSSIPEHRNHGLVSGDLAIQPMAGVSVPAYIARRVRWLRVRKWTVTLATLVEPGVESLLCCLYFAFTMTTLPQTSEYVKRTWMALLQIWLASVSVWILLDRATYRKLHACQSVEADENTPNFARGSRCSEGRTCRPFAHWLMAWAGREVLALPIWTLAVLLGTTVTWRGKRFFVRMDMTVVEVDDKGNRKKPFTNGTPKTQPVASIKARKD